jgi:hypothetical protein
MYKAIGAIPPNYLGDVKVTFNLVNPKDNWGTIGFKIKTYEVIGDEEYIVDMIESNDLIPALQCYSPCQYCQKNSGGVVIDKNYCTQCWQNFEEKYLMTYSEFDFSSNKGSATCKTQCDVGFTSNGNPMSECEKCSETCA